MKKRGVIVVVVIGLMVASMVVYLLTMEESEDNIGTLQEQVERDREVGE